MIGAPYKRRPSVAFGDTSPGEARGGFPTEVFLDMDELSKTIATRGDLAHLALFLWASGASGVLLYVLRELARANQRFEDFVKEIAALNQLFKRKD